MNNIFYNNMRIYKPSINEKKDYPRDSIHTTQLLTYTRQLPISYPDTERPNQINNKYFLSKQINNKTNNISSNNDTIFDIKELTINNNTNLTNLNFFFLYNSKTVNNEKKKNHFPKNIYQKVPEDSIRKKIIKLKSNPKDNIREKNNKYQKKNSRSIQKTLTTPFNNTVTTFKGNKQISNEVKSKDKLSFHKKTLTETKTFGNDPKGKLILSEFTIINQLGRGTFGKIYAVKWKTNNKKYALKKEIINDYEYIEKRQNIIKIIKDFLEKTKNEGIIKIYSNFWEKNKDEYNYYELMEIGEHDLEKEINERRNKNLLYTEKELINIAYQLINSLSLLQKNHITHRDIKPQNILSVNGQYKLCDFGEIRIMKRDGLVVQRIRGSELYMSPILFYGLRENLIQVRHNTYKSDVFSLGMCLIYAATMYFNCIDEIREITDMKKMSFVLNKYLGKNYSNKFISLVNIMLQIKEENRPDFIELEKKLNNIYSL